MRPKNTVQSEFRISLFFCSSHIIDIQTRITERALELLALPEDEACMVLDIG